MLFTYSTLFSFPLCTVVALPRILASEFNFPPKKMFAQIFLAVMFSNFPEDESLSDILGQRKVLI